MVLVVCLSMKIVLSKTCTATITCMLFIHYSMAVMPRYCNNHNSQSTGHSKAVTKGLKCSETCAGKDVVVKTVESTRIKVLILMYLSALISPERNPLRVV